MTRENQKEIIIAIMDSIKESMIKKVDSGKVPESFDGFDIRHWIAMTMEHEDYLSKINTKYKPALQKRRRDCENDVLVNGLY